MRESLINFSNRAVVLLTSLTVISAILFFLPTTSEFFEFNKFTLIFALTVIALLLWSLRMVLEKRTVFTRTPLDVPIIALTIVFLVSSLASIDTYVSFFGKHGRVWPSFFSLVILIVIYFTTTANLKNRKQVNIILWVLAVSTTIASTIALVSYFGTFLPFDFAQIRSFNPLGIANRLALLQAFVIPITAYWAIYEKNKVIRAVATTITLTLAFSFILISDLPAYIGLAAGLGFLTFGALRLKLSKNQRASALALIILISIFLVVRFVPQVARGTLYAWINVKEAGISEQEQIDTPKEKSSSLQATWEIAFGSIGKRPILGTGPATYQFVYTQLKPRYVNSTEDWVIRFEKPSSEFAEILTTTGIVGALAYLFFALTTLKFVWALIFKSQNSTVYLPLAAAISGLIVASFALNFSFATATVFFIALALLSTLAKANDERQVFEITVEVAALKNKFGWFNLGVQNQAIIKTEEGARGPRSQILPWLFAIIVAILSIFALTQQINVYRGEYFYRQALLASRSGDGNKIVNLLQKAIDANGRVDTYHRYLSQTSLNAALNLSKKANIGEEEQQLLSQLVQVSIDQGKAASGYQILPLRLPGISAGNVVNWESLSTIYQTLIGSVGGADVHATNTLTQAVSLDPQNPILHNRLGQLYQRLGDLDLAQRKYEDATIVKGDFGPAHYSLANLLIEREGDIARIVSELTFAKQFLPQDDPARADIEEKLQTYNEKLRNLQEQSSQSQVPEASPKPSPSPSPSPSPTTSPSPSPSF